jgi:two-component system chemotaxis response regulator CheY
MTENIKYKFHNLKVLVVDDHMLMRKLVEDGLRRIGISNITTASTAEDAWDELNTSEIAYDLIMLDWKMPGMGGLELLKKCRGQEKYKKTAIVMLTGENEEKKIKEAIAAGVTSYLVKPVSVDGLAKSLEHVFKWFEKNNIKITKVKKDKPDVIAEVKPTKPNDVQLPKEVIEELHPTINTLVKDIFSELFSVEIDIGKEVKLSDIDSGKHLICIGKIFQDNMSISLRFFFTYELLHPLLLQFYSEKLLQDKLLYQDAACEIVNILCSKIKTFINQYGYQLDLDIPYILSTSKLNEDDTDTAINVYFLLQNEIQFLVDISNG